MNSLNLKNKNGQKNDINEWVFQNSRLRWQEPISEYPIEKCNTSILTSGFSNFWFRSFFFHSTDELTCSRYIDEGHGSLFQFKICLSAVNAFRLFNNIQNISRVLIFVFQTQNYFEFHDLMPDSIYYIQVNALSSFGRKRLRSERVPILVNTTIASTWCVYSTYLVSKSSL